MDYSLALARAELAARGRGAIGAPRARAQAGAAGAAPPCRRTDVRCLRYGATNRSGRSRGC